MGLGLDFDRLRWVWEEGVLSGGTAPAEERWKVMCTDEELCLSVQFSCSVVSDSLRGV